MNALFGYQNTHKQMNVLFGYQKTFEIVSNGVQEHRQMQLKQKKIVYKKEKKKDYNSISISRCWEFW